MLSEQQGPVVDADGHVLEPADTWLQYIDPQYRDRAIRIMRDGKGHEVLLFDNKPPLGASVGVVAELQERLATLPPAAQRKVLGENAVRFYKLAAPAAKGAPGHGTETVGRH